MAILSSDFSALTDDLQEIFNEVASTNTAEMVGNKVFKVKDTNRLTYDYLVLHGMDVIKAVAEGQDLPASTVVEGDTATWTQQYYGGIVSVTKKMRKFDLYDQIDSVVRSAVDDAFYKVDQSMADVLLYGFSASSYTNVYGVAGTSATGPDAVCLFSASHSNNINSNLFRNLIYYGTENPALTREAVAATIKRGRIHKDPTGHSRPVIFDTLLVSPSLEDEALRIVFTDKLPGGFDNDTNVYLRGKLKVKVWEKLETRSDGTDTSAYWFMYDSKKVGETLKALFAERPSLDAPEQGYKDKNWNYSIDFYYALGLGYAPFIWGSTGAGS